jgi:hypothetical protein
VTPTARSRRRAGLLAAGVALVVMTSPLTACAEVESAAVDGYQPARVEGEGDAAKRVIFTAEGARRTGLETGTIQRRAGRTVVPYAALIYDAVGDTFVYAITAPRTYVREAVDIEDIRGNMAFLAGGPPAGTTVVTTGAAEVYGAELEIAGDH